MQNTMIYKQMDTTTNKQMDTTTNKQMDTTTNKKMDTTTTRKGIINDQAVRPAHNNKLLGSWSC